MARNRSRDSLPTPPPTRPSAPQPAGPPPPAPQPEAQPAPQPAAPWAGARQQAADSGALSVIRPSADRMARYQEAFTGQLHVDMARLIPGSVLPPEFDMWTFCRRMVRTLLWAALTDHPEHMVAETLRQVGAQNWFEGFPDEEYANVAHALIQTVHYLTQNDWSTTTGSAWVSFFMWVESHMLAGAGQAAAEDAAAREAEAREAAARRAAAEREAARVTDLSRRSPGRHGQAVSDVNLERVASILDDDDDEEDSGYGQIMISMTRNPLKGSPRHPERHPERRPE
jgi:hypothetical protein